jgi:hypothetical protein
MTAPDTHSSTNQRRTEPPHDPVTPPASAAAPLAGGTLPAVAREGLADGETDNAVPPTGTLSTG